VKNLQLQIDVTITEKRAKLKTVKMSQVEFGIGGCELKTVKMR
jgi:hypothetical protein